jgi:ABC-type transport system involved in cytochrome c biogenesis permease subunit
VNTLLSVALVPDKRDWQVDTCPIAIKSACFVIHISANGLFSSTLTATAMATTTTTTTTIRLVD